MHTDAHGSVIFIMNFKRRISVDKRFPSFVARQAHLNLRSVSGKSTFKLRSGLRLWARCADEAAGSRNGTAGGAEAEVVVLAARGVPVAACGAAVPGVAVPRAAPGYPVRAR